MSRFADAEISSIEYNIGRILEEAKKIQEAAEKEIIKENIEARIAQIEAAATAKLEEERKRSAELLNKIQELQKPIGHIEALYEYKGHFPGCIMSSVWDFNTRSSLLRTANTPEIALKYLEENYNAALAIKQKNEEKIKNNKELRDNIINLLLKAGFSKQESVKKRTRYSTISSPWLTEIQKIIKTTDSWSEYLTQHKFVLSIIQQWQVDVNAENAARALEEERKLEVERKAREAIEEKLKKEYNIKVDQYEEFRKIAYYAAKLNLGPEATAVDIVNKLVSSNKYLKLVHFLNKETTANTIDFKYAKKGIEGFSISAPEDSSIYSDITSLIKSGENGEVDGNVFITNNWCINKLRDMIKPEIIKVYDMFISDCGGVELGS